MTSSANKTTFAGDVYTLVLSGTNGAFKVWQTQNPASTNAPLLVCGRTVTNGVNDKKDRNFKKGEYSCLR